MALNAPFRDGTIQDLAKEVVALALEGLKARQRLDGAGSDESGYLSELAEIANSGRTLAEAMLNRYENEWDGNVDAIFKTYAY